MMNFSSAGGLPVHAMVNLIMAAKPLDTIVGQPTTESMDQMTEQMVQMVPPFKTTAWGGLHGALALVLNDANYATVTHQEDYFGYANQTIKSLLAHLCTNWCKVMTKERTDATKAFYHA
jgi:hypothetical protein